MFLLAAIKKKKHVAVFVIRYKSVNINISIFFSYCISKLFMVLVIITMYRLSRLTMKLVSILSLLSL